ncbi:MAG: bifunctional non-homologous end joining protein LigD [Acidimicrobiales bacterium]|jgi:bifunctional non-homologous end joining protein LigD
MTVTVSNGDRLIFPDDGVTKADVVAHYAVVADHLLAFATGRPLTLQRFPKGIEAKGFMQKNASKHFPTSIGRMAVPKRGGGQTIYPVVNQADDIAYLANQGTVTFHMWTTSAARPTHPDWLVMDLDPDEGDVLGARDATKAVGELLAEFDLEGFPLATGSTGFHVWVRLDGSTTTGDVSATSRALAGLATCRHPNFMTMEFLKKKREGRVFVDWLRNTPTATTVVPFSLRPRSGAPVAVPLTWDELETAAPAQWTIGHIDDRLDLAARLSSPPVALPTEAIMAGARKAGVDLDTPHDRFGRS